MKKILNFKNILTLTALGLFLALGCKKSTFLDPVTTTNLNEATVFADSARTTQFLSNIYSGLSFMTVPVSVTSTGTFLSFSSDESEQRWVTSEPANLININSYTGSWVSLNQGNWNYLFQKIRAINIYLKDVDSSPLSTAAKTRTKLEARFLRAYFYSVLMNFYSGVPLIGDDVESPAVQTSIIRSSYADCVNYVTSELTACAAGLPASYTGIDFGRITSGAALALKGKVLLYAASPLFNGGAAINNPTYGYPTSDNSRWKAAFDALQAVINLNRYSLVIDNSKPGIGFYNMFLTRSNSEFILTYQHSADRVIEGWGLPPTRGAAATRTDYPTQEFVDAFTLRDGTPVTNRFDYKGRDPRFYFSIIYNGAPYWLQAQNGPVPVWTYLNAATDGEIDSFNTIGAPTKTGYYLRKMCDSTLTTATARNIDRAWPIIRYADVLLMYAEAANELGQSQVAIDQIKTIRQRAGILPGINSNYGIPGGLGQDSVRSLIQKERMVELGFEQQRFFDVRRWKLGIKLLNKSMNGVYIVKTGGSSPNFTYNFSTRQLFGRTFTTSSYLWPIPQTELYNTPGFLQNPGW